MHLLLLPGMDGTGRLFEPLLGALSPQHTTRVASYPPNKPLGYGELLPLVESAADEGGDFIVVGESFSGPLALMLAAKNPTGLRGVVLCASFIRFPLSAIPLSWRMLVRPWMFRFQPLWLIKWALLGRYRNGNLGKMLVEAVRSVSPEAMAARAQSVATVDVTEQLRACPVPVLYLKAADDQIIRSWCFEMVRTVRPDCQIAILPGPHLVLQASPGEAARILEAFCDQVTSHSPKSTANG